MKVTYFEIWNKLTSNVKLHVVFCFLSHHVSQLQARESTSLTTYLSRHQPVLFIPNLLVLVSRFWTTYCNFKLKRRVDSSQLIYGSPNYVKYFTEIKLKIWIFERMKKSLTPVENQTGIPQVSADASLFTKLTALIRYRSGSHIHLCASAFIYLNKFQKFQEIRSHLIH